LTDTLEEIQRRIPQEWNECVVVNAQGIVLGMLDTDGWNVDPRVTAEQVMRSGPATFRPRHSISDALNRMRKHDTQYVLVTTPEGRLIGILTRGDVERASAETVARPQ
jgi:CBS domain-containing protein